MCIFKWKIKCLQVEYFLKLVSMSANIAWKTLWYWVCAQNHPDIVLSDTSGQSGFLSNPGRQMWGGSKMKLWMVNWLMKIEDNGAKMGRAADRPTTPPAVNRWLQASSLIQFWGYQIWTGGHSDWLELGLAPQHSSYITCLLPSTLTVIAKRVVFDGLKYVNCLPANLVRGYMEPTI